MEKYIFNPFWTVIADYCLPDWLAPNLLTILGLLVPLAQMVVIGMYSAGFDQVLPNWVWLLCFVGLFWFQTIDSIDGKQARRINNCSPIGQLLDHNLDQISFTCFMCHVCAMFQVKGNIWIILALTPGVFSAHYSIEYRSHFTKWHITVVGLLGATEQLVFVMAATLTPYFAENSNNLYSVPVDQLAGVDFFEPFLGRAINYGDLIVLFACISGVHFNLHNIIATFFEIDTKGYGLMAMLPYV